MKKCYSRFHFHVLDYCKWLRMPDELSIPRMPSKQIELWDITSPSGNFQPYQIQTENIHFKRYISVQFNSIQLNNYFFHLVHDRLWCPKVFILLHALSMSFRRDIKPKDLASKALKRIVPLYSASFFYSSIPLCSHET